MAIHAALIVHHSGGPTISSHQFPLLSSLHHNVGSGSILISFSIIMYVFRMKQRHCCLLIPNLACWYSTENVYKSMHFNLRDRGGIMHPCVLSLAWISVLIYPCFLIHTARTWTGIPILAQYAMQQASGPSTHFVLPDTQENVHRCAVACDVIVTKNRGNLKTDEKNGEKPYCLY
jgi:hypothetical protein